MCRVTAAVFVVALACGIAAGGALWSYLVAHPAEVEQFRLVGPMACAAVGLALVAPDKVRPWLAPIVAVLAGLGYGLAARVFDPTVQHDWRFAGTLTAVALWLVAVPLLLGRPRRLPWFRIATRIAGSWLLAIGILLGAVQILPKRNAPPPAASLTVPPPLDAPSAQS
jgi:hypothetical protein